MIKDENSQRVARPLDIRCPILMLKINPRNRKFRLLLNLLRHARRINQIFKPQLFGRKLLFKSALGDASGTYLVKHPVVGVAK